MPPPPPPPSSLSVSVRRFPPPPHSCDSELIRTSPSPHAATHWVVFTDTGGIAWLLCLFLGKIQGDGRKFLDRFKSYFGSQISSQSLNEVHIYRLQPKSVKQKVIFSLSYIVFDCFESASRVVNGERSRRSAAGEAASLNKLWQLKTAENERKKLQSENAQSWVRLSCQNRH